MQPMPLTQQIHDAHAVPATPQQPVRVRVVDLDISFGQMVVLMLKFAIASIPAAMILGAVAGVLVLFLGALGAAIR